MAKPSDNHSKNNKIISFGINFFSNLNLLIILWGMVVLSFVVIGTMAWKGGGLYQELSLSRNNELRLQQLTGNIIYFDEVLTMSARMAAAREDLSWGKRYRTFENKLTLAIKEIIPIVPEIIGTKFIEQTSEANNKLVAYENTSFSLVKEGNPKAALELLFGKNYEEQKTIYAQGIRNFIDQVRLYAITKVNEKLRRLIWFGVFILVTITSAWYFVLLSLKKHLSMRVKADLALAQSEERLNLALAATSEGVWDWNIETDEVFFTNQWCESLGYSPDEIKPHLDSWKNLIHPDDMPKVMEVLNAHFEGKTQIFEIENRLKMKSGAWRWNLDRGKVVKRDENGNPVRMVGTETDITARKIAEIALKESERLLKSIINNSTAVIYLKDTHGRYLLINRQYEILFNITTEEIKGKTDLDLFPKKDAIQFMNNDKKVLEGGSVLELEETVHHGNELHTYISVKFPIRGENGTLIGVAGISTNITERKKAEEKLKTYALELQRSNNELETFAYLTSHDLQEPLRKIITFGDLLEQRTENLDEQSKDYIYRMKGSAEKMRVFIHDLLEFSRVTKKVKPFEPVDLGNLIEEVVKDFEDKINNMKGNIHVGKFPTLKVGRIQMHRLFQNLISNAIKYSREGTPPVINLTSLFNEDTESWEIRVEDNGIGFEEKYMDRIFKPFERLHSKTAYEGTGIGLAICEKIVHLHGGEISAKSSPGNGATFIIILPKICNC